MQKDPMVQALIALCNREGSYKDVAAIARVSPDNLWQIISGTKLPSGNPRGVGPSLRKKITDAFPNWLATGQGTPDTLPALIAPQNTPPALTGRAGGAMEGVAISDKDMVRRLAQKMNKASPGMVSAILALLGEYAKNPEDDKLNRQIAALLSLDDNDSAI